MIGSQAFFSESFLGQVWTTYWVSGAAYPGRLWFWISNLFLMEVQPVYDNSYRDLDIRATKNLPPISFCRIASNSSTFMGLTFARTLLLMSFQVYISKKNLVVNFLNSKF
jgi:hypothetical protein